MAFRDDRDAQLARTAALERENAQLKAQLEASEAEARAREAAAEARARQVDPERARAAALAKDNARLADELKRARGPSLARRALARIAALRLPEPHTDGGYWRAATLAWRLYVPVLVALALQAPLTDATGWIVLAMFALGAPVLAGIALAVPWALGRRRQITAAAVASGAVGVAMSGAIAGAFAYRASTHELEMFHVYVSVAAIYVSLALLLVTRVLEFGQTFVALMFFAWLLVFPHPLQLAVPTAFAFWGARLIDPTLE